MSFVFLHSKQNTLRKLFYVPVKALNNRRNYASGRRRKIVSSKQQRSEKIRPEETPVEATIETPPIGSAWEKVQAFITPTRFRTAYTREQFMELLRRFPLWVILSCFALWDGTAPWTVLSIRGPSMLPTMAADGSELWLVRTRAWHFWGPLYQVGDLVGFAHPDHAAHISCKRVVGVAGDRVKRYGEYVRLYVQQDPQHWGQSMPEEGDGTHDWIDRGFSWDDRNYCEKDKQKESMRTIVVPPGHVWLESDCPALGVDSRQHGPVPENWVRGRVVRRVWPWINMNDHRVRPHPIPLDTDTLLLHNVHIKS